MPELKKTPLYINHKALGARLVPFAGYEMPVQYSSVLEETKRTRANVGLFDVSHMGQFRIKGKGALEAINGLVTNNLAKTIPGQAQYNLLCNENGGVIDDLVIYHISRDEVFICANASNLSTDYEWLKGRLPTHLDLVDESEATALIAIQGPKAEAVIAGLVKNEPIVKGIGFYRAASTEIDGETMFLSRTGYTGEDGFEIYLPASKASAFWDMLMDRGQVVGILPAGLAARDILRTEMGYPLHGHELSPEISPIASGLRWVVKLKKPADFVGKTALAKDVAEGTAKLLRAFTLDDRRIARAGYDIEKDGKRIGKVTSGVFSPHLAKPIGLGFVESLYKEETELQIRVRTEALPAKTCKLPFIPSRTKHG